MNMKSILFIMVVLSISITGMLDAQTLDRPRPAEWNNLVFGGRFMDRFLPMPGPGKLSRDTWGAENVLPRFVENGIENRVWSFWGGNIVKSEDGKYHLYVCGWREDSPKGHATWPGSLVFHAVGSSSLGPFTVRDTIGKGHNPEIFRLTDGRYVIYVIGGYYISDSTNGPWTYGRFEFKNRDRRLIEGNSNFTFAQREDGSYLMICRGGGQWFSQTGLSAYNQVTGTRLGSNQKIISLRAYPDREGKFEDPVVWRDNVQYNLIVNDWLGRIAYYLRSKDGVNWKEESGEAYLPGISYHPDGSVEAWHKYERIKVFQDNYGRAIQANFAVIDVEKNLDKGSDIHSSKNICIPLTTGRLLTILNRKPISQATRTIKVRIEAEPGFNPQTNIDLASLQFGEPEAVNYGKGGKVLQTEKSGSDLVITFDASGNKFPPDEFAAKLLGKTSDGKLLFGYARLPGVDFKPPVLSALLPVFSNGGSSLNVEVQNFGLSGSVSTPLKVTFMKNDREETIATGKIPPLKPYEKTTVKLSCKDLFEPGGKKPVFLHGKLTPVKK